MRGPWVTNLLVLVNLAVFGVEQSRGGSERADVLVGLGAMVPRLVRDYEQGWRLLTAGFLHIGIAHLAVNLVALAIVGRVVERVFGHRRFLVLYVASALGGAAASYAFGGAHISAGASGAIFGLVGAGLALWLSHGRLSEHTEGLGQLAGVLAAVTLVNLAYGFLQEGVDSWNHLGGVLAGLIVALALDPGGRLRPGPAVVNGLFALGVASLGWAGHAAATNPVDVVDPAGDELVRYFNETTRDYRRGYDLLADLAVRVLDSPLARQRDALGHIERRILPLAEKLFADLEGARVETEPVLALHHQLLAQARAFGAALRSLRAAALTLNDAARPRIGRDLRAARRQMDAWRRAVSRLARDRGYAIGP